MSETPNAPASGTEVLHYTAFSADPAGGNPAGVVLDASGLDDAAMLAIAAELGYSESAFLTAPDGHGGYRIRYFSPKAEVPFCGHATVATAIALAHRDGPGDLLFATRAGTVPVTVTREGGELRATLTSVEPRITDIAPADLAEALAALGWPATDLDPALPPRIAFAGASHLVLAAATRQRLADLSYDYPRLGALMHRLGLTTLHLVWRESASVFHVRDPFPVGGVVEDPATGAAAAAFGAYLRDLALVPDAAVLTLHQGEDLGRPGTLTVELRPDDPRIRVSGTGTRIVRPPTSPRPHPWATIDRWNDWLDAKTRLPPEEDLLLRMLKLSEEVGEVAQAVIGATGQNPRKGRSHSWQDVEAELCDVIVTAMIVLRTLTPDAHATFDRHLDRVTARSLGEQADVCLDTPN